jgi:signal transduction histidine kinase
MTNLFNFFIKDSYCYSALVDQTYVSTNLLFYTHIPTAIISLIVGIYIYYRNPKNLPAKIFFLLTFFFFLFTMGDLVEWFAFLGRNQVMFARTIIQLIDPLLFIIAFYFLYVLIKKKDLANIYKVLWLLPLLPAVAAIFLGINIIGYDWANCEVIENPLLTKYGFCLDIFYTISIVTFSLMSIIKEKVNKKQVTITTVAISSFVILFFTTEYIFTGYILGEALNYSYFIYAFLGMPLLIIFLAYLIIKFKTFQTRLISTEIFVFGIFSLIFFQYFFIETPIAITLNTVALIFAAIVSKLLIKSVKNEIEQKEKLAKQEAELEELIKQRESLVHLVTHKVKGSFTRSKYIFAGILDGTFGPISDVIKKYAEQGLESDKMGIETVDLVLSVANMQKGTVKYDIKEMDFKEMILKTISEKEISAEAKGLKIENAIKEDTYKVMGDAFWLKEAVNNLIENSIKYTKEGTITVNLEKKDGKVLLSVKDTGVGITDEDKKNLFTEGGRGKDSVKINVDSTGYGLYSVKLIMDAHKGRVWAESEGPGKGSTFFVEVPAA